jgi:hypothetical protein
MPTQITSAGITFNDTTSLTSADGVPSALKLTTARTINGVSFDGTGNITIPATSISGANVAKAWVNFNGTGTIGTNQTIRSQYNVSSITKNGVGNYTVNFSTAMLDSNYTVLGTSTATNSNTDGATNHNNIVSAYAANISYANVMTLDSSGGYQDAITISVAIFGN